MESTRDERFTCYLTTVLYSLTWNFFSNFSPPQNCSRQLVVSYIGISKWYIALARLLSRFYKKPIIQEALTEISKNNCQLFFSVVYYDVTIHQQKKARGLIQADRHLKDSELYTLHLSIILRDPLLSPSLLFYADVRCERCRLTLYLSVQCTYTILTRNNMYNMVSTRTMESSGRKKRALAYLPSASLYLDVNKIAYRFAVNNGENLSQRWVRKVRWCVV